MHSMDRLTSKPTPLAGFVLLIVGLGFIVFIAAPGNSIRSLSIGGDRAEERRAAREEVDSLGAAELGSYGVIDADSGRYRLSIDRTMGIMVRDWRNNSQEGRKKFLERVQTVYPESASITSPSNDSPSLDSFE